MALAMKPVYSSWIAEIGYDDEAQAVVVRTQKGATITYDNVPPEIAAEVGALGDKTPPSIGEALHNMIRGKFGHSVSR